MLKVLIVEDERMIADFIGCGLAEANFEYDCAYDGLSAADMIDQNRYDLILLDVMLPGVDGFELMRYIAPLGIPVIFLTAKAGVDDRVAGLRLGADDYIVKPFEPKELVARVKAVLRRYEPKQEEDKNILKFGELEINLSNYSVLYHGKSLDFPPKEFELLSFLAQHPNRVFTREQLLDRIWGYEYVGDTRTVDVHVKRIREKLNSEDEWGIRTVWSVGYKFGQK